MELTTKKNQSGNVLFLILIAVGLFATLSYAVTSSSRGGGKNASEETDRTQAAALLQWFTAVDTAVMRMRASGIPNENISFIYNAKQQNGNASLDYMDNTRCTSDACRIFNPGDGGVNLPNFVTYGVASPSGASATNLASGYAAIVTMQWPDAGTTANDIVILMYFMQPRICSAMNTLMGVKSIPTITGTANLAFTPDTWDTANYIVATNADQITNKSNFSGVISGSGNGKWCFIYHLMMAR